ncbi:hypothetical protein AB6A40_002185 [Gnathostoma spinigerum]|uniref:Uncharacterized protein n=1 Tax=Gnathostoma spinigerum TaxID=75299 RepID=A0ABD6EDM0_9BILA
MHASASRTSVSFDSSDVLSSNRGTSNRNTLNHSISERKTSVHSATSGQQPSWFAGLKSRISQISMPDWLSQLGIGSTVHAANYSVSSQPCQSTLSSSGDSEEKKSNIQKKKKMVERTSEVLPVTSSASDHRTCNDKISNVNDWSIWSFDTSLWNVEGDCDDTLIRQHFGPLKNLLTLCQQPGKGHEFMSLSIVQPTWCDKCGDFMWGFLTNAVKCKNCNYTCHARCQTLVTLDCRSASGSANMDVSDVSSTPLYPDIQKIVNINDVMLSEPVSELMVGSSAPCSLETNSSANEPSSPPLECQPRNLDVNLNKATVAVSSGLVQIHMNFTRPINVVAGQTPPTFLDVVNSAGTSSMNSFRTITTFFLPRNTVKTVNISWDITTRQMIVTLLRKFRVADNPRKFALYSRDVSDEPSSAVSDFKDESETRSVQMVRLEDDAYPLRIYHGWIRHGLKRQFVLQENDTGDILWEMFEVPELENFLTILLSEEKQYIFRIRQKYDAYRFYLDEQLRSRGYLMPSDDDGRNKEMPHDMTSYVLQEDDLESMSNTSKFGTARFGPLDDPFSSFRSTET